MSDTAAETVPEARHGSPAWIPRFVSWARSEVDGLDFDHASVPDRLLELLEAAGVTYTNAEPHEHVEPEHDLPEVDEGKGDELLEDETRSSGADGAVK